MIRKLYLDSVILMLTGMCLRCVKLALLVPLLWGSCGVTQAQTPTQAQATWEKITDIGIDKHIAREYDSALFYFDASLKLAEREFGKSSTEYTDAAGNLGMLYSDIGRFEDAERYLLEAVSLAIQVYGETHATYGISLTFLGIYYGRVGNYELAEKTYRKALAVFERYPDLRPTRYADLLSSLSTLYFFMEQYDESVKLAKVVCDIRKNHFGEAHVKYARNLSYLGAIHGRIGRLNEAKADLEKALVVLTTSGTKEDIRSAKTNLGTVELALGNIENAERLYTESAASIKVLDGGFSRELFNLQRGLVKLYRRKGDYPMVKQLYSALLDGIAWQTNANFKFMADLEKERFYRTIRKEIDAFNAFCVQHPDDALVEKMYDEQLATKALILTSSNRWKQRIRTSGDKKLFMQYLQWETQQATLLAWQQQNNPARMKAIDSLESVCTALEKEIAKRSEAFAMLNQKTAVTWKSIKSKLGPSEVAIEVIRVPEWGVRKWVTDSSSQEKTQYPFYDLTDAVNYVALIVHSNSTYPEMVMLGNGDRLETKGLAYYKNCINGRLSDQLSYGHFWEPLELKLKKLKKGPKTTVYLSGDGVYHKINLNTLFNPKSKRYLFEDYDIRLVTNTREIVTGRTPERGNNLAYIFAAPDFSSLSQSNLAFGWNGPSTLEALPGSKREGESIASLLQTKDWQVDLKTGAHCSEGAIKDCYKPGILHIATHGFFLPEGYQSKANYYSYRSGLFLSGSGSNAETTEDGFLSTNEIANLNLDNTDLVVLSACETGLGEIQNGEGVHGLQRAFKVAGARTILMTLWKIDDQVTEEWMVLFYNNLLKSGNKSEAMLISQQEIMKKYPQPYYWGAFVLVGY